MGTVETSGLNQYLTYTLGGETFGLDIAKVREILDYAALTRVPNMPSFMRGVINLRGAVVPVVDLRLRFGMSATEKTAATCIIISEVTVDGETAILGALADSVQEVLDIEPALIDPPPRIGSRIKTDFISGMGKHGHRFIILLDIDRIFPAEDLSLIPSLQEVPEQQLSAGATGLSRRAV